MIVSGEPLLSPALLLRAAFAPWNPSALDSLLGGRAELFAYGRQGLARVLCSVDDGGGQILVPAYICDTVVHGIAAAGWQWRYYPLDDRLGPDWGWLERHPDLRDRAMLLVHYFGFPSDLQMAVRYSESRRLSLIEDCAHAFLTAVASPSVGRSGAAAIYSWRKFAPVANGGAFVLPAGAGSNQHEPDEKRPRDRRPGLRSSARQLGKWLMFTTGSRLALRTLGATLSDEYDPPSASARGDVAPDLMSTKVLAAQMRNLKRIAQKRRGNYTRLYELCSRLGAVAPITPPLVEGVVPWCLPIVTRENEAGERLVEYLLRSGVGAWSWPELAADVRGETFPHEVALAARTVCLPVHQSLGPRHVRYMAKVLTQWDQSERNEN